MNKIYEMYFSPTKTSKKIADAIADGLDIRDISINDFTLPGAREKSFDIEDGIVVLAAPVYFGRVEVNALEYIKSNLKGNNTPIILAAVYGNRDFDDALVELYDVAKENGFVPIACGGFSAEHSYSTAESPIAENRPDRDDIEAAMRFGSAAKAKLDKLENLDNADEFEIRGNRPYRPGGKIPAITSTPKVNKKLCRDCKICAKNCPMGAILFDDVSKVDKSKCIHCQACVKLCPYNAKSNKSILIKKIGELLSEKLTERRTPEFFM